MATQKFDDRALAVDGAAQGHGAGDGEAQPGLRVTAPWCPTLSVRGLPA